MNTLLHVRKISAEKGMISCFIETRYSHEIGRTDNECRKFWAKGVL